FEILPVVENVQEPVFQLLRVLPDNAIEVNQVAVGVVEDFSHGPLLVEKNGAAAPEHFHIHHVLVAGWEPSDDRGEQCLFPADPWNDRLDKSPPSFVCCVLTAWPCPGLLPAGAPPGSGLSRLRGIGCCRCPS